MTLPMYNIVLLIIMCVVFFPTIVYANLKGFDEGWKRARQHYKDMDVEKRNYLLEAYDD